MAGSGVPLGQPPAGLVESIASVSKVALAFIGIRLALPIIFRFVPVYRFLPPESAGAIMDGVEGLVGLLALIFYFVWFSRIYTFIRVTRGETRYSNGMAIGGWFIPFANFVMPYLALRDAWRRGANDENGFLVAIWWLCYLLAMVMTMFWSVGAPALAGKIDIETSRSVFPALGWLGLLAQVGAWGLLGFFVQNLTARASAPR
jgi:hypothetical protein